MCFFIKKIIYDLFLKYFNDSLNVFIFKVHGSVMATRPKNINQYSKRRGESTIAFPTPFIFVVLIYYNALVFFF
jgi:hypothetical protein